jgi:hypothetical protein
MVRTTFLPCFQRRQTKHCSIKGCRRSMHRVKTAFNYHLQSGIYDAIGRTGTRHTSHSPATLNAKLCYRVIKGVAMGMGYRLICSTYVPKKEVVRTLRAFKLNVSGLGLPCWSADHGLRVEGRQVACSCSQPLWTPKPPGQTRSRVFRAMALHEEGGDATLAKAGCASPDGRL